MNNIRINIHLEREKQRIALEMESDSTLIDLVRELGKPVDGVLIFKGPEPLPLDTVLADIEGFEIRLIAVASGG